MADNVRKLRVSRPPLGTEVRLRMIMASEREADELFAMLVAQIDEGKLHLKIDAPADVQILQNEAAKNEKS